MAQAQRMAAWRCELLMIDEWQKRYIPPQSREIRPAEAFAELLEERRRYE
jgi:hypothetical protein